MFYKWPHGRLIRVIAMIVALVICIDFAYNGAYGRFGAYQEGAERARQGISVAQDPTHQLILGIIYAAIAAAVLITGIILAGVHKRAVDFLIEVEHEMTKVDWPTSSVLWRATIIIGITIVVLALGIVLVDLGIYTGLQSLYSLGSSF
jgi:preprotein translocase SecE subunit